MKNHDNTSGCANCSPDGEPQLMHKMIMGKFGLLGEKLSHSFSPLIHSYLADYEYLLYEKAPDEVDGFLRNGDFDGMNVTIPYKKTVIPYCAGLSEYARKTGSVNTIVRGGDGTFFGDTTDCYGFAYMLEKAGVRLNGKKALVLGSGGASRAVQVVLEERGAGEIVIVSRTGAVNYQNIGEHSDAHIIVNTTPVGMYPRNGESPVDLRGFGACEAVLDLIYNPAKTALLLDAQELGITAVNGLSMLVAQAKKVAEIFTGKAIPDSVIGEIEGRILGKTQNIVLIGMPGCGKTSVGEQLAEITGREFFDTDTMVEEKAGKSVPQVIEEDGEEAFRRLETDVLREASAKSGCVIASGGGIVKRAENRRLIEQNGVAVFIDRALDALPSEGRPLSQSTGIEALAEERLPIYRQWSSFTVSGEGILKQAQEIKELMGI